MLLLSLLLQAEDFTYAIHTQNNTPYLKEPVLLTVDINQTNPDVVLFFRFEIPKSDAYTVKQIDATHDDTLHHASIHYRYLLYPLKTGKITVPFTLIKRLTDEAKVAYSFSGDRDDFKKLETKDIPIDVTPLNLKVRPLPEKTRFIGDFTIKTLFPKNEAEAYEAIPMRVSIEGIGYPPLTDALLPKEIGITHFDSKPVLTQTTVGDHIKYKAVYELALSSPKSFTLPEIAFGAFNPKTRKQYLLTIPEHRFTVKPVNVNTLTDRVDNPKPLQVNWEWLGNLLGCLLAFVSGFVTAWLFKYKRKVTASQADPLLQKIADCSDKRSLLQLLLANDPARFEKVIAKIESDLYQGGSHTLKQLKQEAKEALK
ncbi:MAG: hypothetical protein L3J47_05565 [Sulfurovum sp.]|nr:hypothetical protein [Sulfurovum sp.]